MNEEDQINQIKEAMRNILRQVVARGRPLTPELKQALRDATDHATRRIEELRQQARSTRTPMPTGTDLLWQLANGNPEAFVNYLRTVPDIALNNLLQNPTQLTQIINELSQRLPPQPPEQLDGIPKADLQSSNIYGFKYDPRSGRLFVRFQGGSVYEYDGVPPYIFNIFQRGAVPAKTTGQNEFGSWWIGKQPSLGAAFYDLIRSGSYPYERVA
jgi:hypothetical protein